MARHTRRRGTTRRTRNYIWLAVLIALVGTAVLAVASGRYQVRPVLSGSMRPGLPVGGVVITERVPVSSLHVRDVVVLHRPDVPDELVVHRIISMSQGPDGMIVHTQGDANSEPDPWTVQLRGATAYRVVYTLPLFGYVAVWAHSPAGRESFLLVGLFLLVAAGAGGLLAKRRAAGRSAADLADPISDQGVGSPSAPEAAMQSGPERELEFATSGAVATPD